MERLSLAGGLDMECRFCPEKAGVMTVCRGTYRAIPCCEEHAQDGIDELNADPARKTKTGAWWMTMGEWVAKSEAWKTRAIERANSIHGPYSPP